MNNENADQEDNQRLHELIEESRKLYEKQKSIYCPYLEASISCNADGFKHLLSKTSRLPRTVSEQRLKLRLLKKGIGILKRTRTL
jgi:hypothetical protein